MSKWNSVISASAWDTLVREYDDLGGEDASDHDLAELLRNSVNEVEGAERS